MNNTTNKIDSQYHFESSKIGMEVENNQNM